MNRHEFDIVCLSHLRWDFVFQRPQHLMTRFARERRVFFVEEPIVSEAAETPQLEFSLRAGGVGVAVPRLPPGLDDAEASAAYGELLGGLLSEHAIREFVLWHYTPAPV